MPDPRELGNVARAVVGAVIKALDDNQDDFFDVAVCLHTDEQRRALEILKESAHRNSMSLRALTLLLANKQRAAEEVVLDAAIKAQREADGQKQGRGEK